MDFKKNLDYSGYDKSKKILCNKLGDISRVYKVKFIQLFNGDSNYYKDVNKRFLKIIETIRGLNTEYSIAIQQTIFVKNEFLKFPVSEKDDFFIRENKKFHGSIPQKITEIYFTITLKAPKGKIRGLFYNLFNKNVRTINLKKYDDNLYSVFEEINKIFLEEIQMIKGVFVKLVEKESLEKLIFDKYFNLNFNSNRKIKNVVKSFVEHPYKDYVYVGGEFLKTYSVAHSGIRGVQDDNNTSKYSGLIFEEVYNSLYENNVIQSSYSDVVFGEYDCEKIVTTVVFIEPIEKVKKHIKQNEQWYSYTDQNQSDKTYTSVTRDFIENQNLVYIHLGISLVSNDDEKRFKQSCLNFEKHMDNCGFDLSINYRTNIQQFYNFAFGNIHHLALFERCILPARVVTRFFVFESLKSSKTSSKGIHFKHRFSNNDYYLDLLNIKSSNKNMVLIGASGTGKSVTVGAFIESFYNDGATIYLTDLGYSQENLCHKLNGLYIKITEENPVKLNPFTALNYNEEEKKYSILTSGGGLKAIEGEDNDLDFLVSLFFVCWKSGEKSMSTTEETTITKTITKYIRHLNKIGKKANYQDYYFFTKLLFQKDEELSSLTTKVFDFNSYLLVMSDYLKEDKEKNVDNGRYYFIFDEDEKISNQIKNNRFVVFEFEDIAENDRLTNISSFLISNIVKKRMLSKNYSGRQLVYIKDELHKFIQNKAGGVNYASLSELEYISRTFRKHNSSLILATQSVTDFSNTEKGKVILLNSAIKLLKKQPNEEKSKQIIQESLKFSDKNLEKLYSISDDDRQKSLFIEIEKLSVVLNLYLDKYALTLAETNKDVRTWVEKEIKNTGSIEVAIQNTIEKEKHKPKDNKVLEV